MATFEIQGQDGSTYRVEAENAEQAVRAFKAHTNQDTPAPSAEKPPLPPGSSKEDFMRGVAAGVPFMRDVVAGIGAGGERERAVAEYVKNAPELTVSNMFSKGPVQAFRDWRTATEAYKPEPQGVRSYSDIRADIDKQISEASERSPYAFGTGQVVGAVATPIKGYTGMKGPLGAIAEYGTQGAAQGVLQGLSEGTDLDSRIQKAIEEGTTGTLFGGALGTLGQLAKAGLQRTSPFFSESAAQRAATQKVLNDLEKSGLTPQQAIDKLKEMRSVAPDAKLMDVSPITTERARSVVGRGGQAAEDLAQTAVERQKGQGERVIGAMEGAAGTPSQYVTARDAVQNVLNGSSKNYEKAFEQGAIDSPVIGKYLELPIIQRAYQKGQQLAEIDAFVAARKKGEILDKFADTPHPDTSALVSGIKDVGKVNDSVALGALNAAVRDLPKDATVDQLFQAALKNVKSGNVYIPESLSQPTVKDLNYIQKGLRDIQERGVNGTGIAQEEANTVGNLRKQFLKDVDENAPDFAKARKYHSDTKSIQEAIDNGRNQITGKNAIEPEDLKKMMSRTSTNADEQALIDAQNKAFRIGALSRIATDIKGVELGKDVTKKAGYNIPGLTERLDALLPDQAARDLFQKTLEVERKLFDNSQKIASASDAGVRNQLQNKLGAGVVEAIGDPQILQKTGFTAFARNMLDLITGEGGKAISDKEAKYLTQLLTEGDDKALTKVIKTITEKRARDQATRDTLGRAAVKGAQAEVTSKD